MYVSSDLFQDSNGTTIDNHPDSYGQDWSIDHGSASDISISGDRLFNTGSSPALIYNQEGHDGFSVMALGVKTESGYDAPGVAVCVQPGRDTYYRAYWRNSDAKWVVQKVVSGSASDLYTASPGADSTDPRAGYAGIDEGSTGPGGNGWQKYPRVKLSYSTSGANDVLVLLVYNASGIGTINSGNITVSSDPIHDQGYGGLYLPGSSGHASVYSYTQINGDGELLREYPAPPGYIKNRVETYTFVGSGALDPSLWLTPAIGSFEVVRSGGAFPETGSVNGCFAANVDGSWLPDQRIQVHFTAAGAQGSYGPMVRCDADNQTAYSLTGNHETLTWGRLHPSVSVSGEYDFFNYGASTPDTAGPYAIGVQGQNFDFESGSCVMALEIVGSKIRWHEWDDGVLGDLHDHHIAPFPPVNGYWYDNGTYLSDLTDTSYPSGNPGIILQNGANAPAVVKVMITDYLPDPSAIVLDSNSVSVGHGNITPAASITLR